MSMLENPQIMGESGLNVYTRKNVGPALCHTVYTEILLNCKNPSIWYDGRDKETIDDYVFDIVLDFHSELSKNRE